MPTISCENKFFYKTEKIHKKNFNSLEICGGSQNGEFIYIISSNKSFNKYDIVSEVERKSVCGLTLSDFFDCVNQGYSTKTIIDINLIDSKSSLSPKLSEFLVQRFPKTSKEYSLQQSIRNNLYLRTVPCTTRSPRSGELNGVDYTFVTLEDFYQLKNEDKLIEYGIYEGNLYGTPYPVQEPSNRHHSPIPSYTRADMQYEESQLRSFEKKNESFYKDIHRLSAHQILTQKNMVEDNENRSLSPVASQFESDNTNNNCSTLEKHVSLSSQDLNFKNGTKISAYLCKGSHGGYGFSIKSSNNSERNILFLCINSVIPNSPAFQANVFKQGDIIIEVDGVDVTGFSHIDIQRLFQSFAPAYEVLVVVYRANTRNSNHLSLSEEHVAKDIKISYNNNYDNNLCDKQVPHKLDNGKASNNSYGNYMNCLDHSNIKTLPSSMRNTDYSNSIKDTLKQNGQPHSISSLFVASTKLSQSMSNLANLSSSSSLSLNLNHSHLKSTSPSKDKFLSTALSSDARDNCDDCYYLVEVKIQKGTSGFGFTIADTPQGQVIRKILDHSRCAGLKENDLLYDINGQNILGLPHSSVVENLKSCSFNVPTLFTLKRFSII